MSTCTIVFHCFPVWVANQLALSFQGAANVEALRNLFEDVHAFQIELEFENVGFRENQSTMVGINHSENRLEPGPGLPLIFRPEKNSFFETGPSPRLSQGLDDCPHPPYLKVWICHCYRCDFSTKIPPSHNTGLNWLIVMYAFCKNNWESKMSC